MLTGEYQSRISGEKNIANRFIIVYTPKNKNDNNHACHTLRQTHPIRELYVSALHEIRPYLCFAAIGIRRRELQTLKNSFIITVGSFETKKKQKRLKQSVITNVL